MALPWYNPKRLFRAEVPKDLSKFIGAKVSIPEYMNIDGREVRTGEIKVTIHRIVGNRFNPTYYEINDKYLIGMLRFHAQMEGAKDITEQQFRDFENMQINAEKMK